MKINKQSLRYLLLMLGCFAVLVVFSRYVGNDLPAGVSPTNKQVIVLDAGHGGMDSGAVGVTGVLEKDINLAIVKDLEKLLTFSGYEVVLTRDSDRSMHDDGVTGAGAQKRSDMTNRRNVIFAHENAIFISIHQNKFTQPQYWGAQMFYNTNNPENQCLAQIMQDSFAELQPGNNREIKLSGDELFLFKDTKIPSLLIECGFLSNPDEEARLSTPEYQKKVAFTVFGGLMTWRNSVLPDETDDFTLESETA